MRDRLIELIDKVLVKYDRGCLPFVMNEIADHLIDNGVTVQEWISVKDRLPNAEDVNETHDALAIHKTSKQMQWHWKFVKDFPDEFTHWMPMPQPPKGE